MRKYLVSTIALAACQVLFAPIASAQEAQAAPVVESDKGITEVIVTAERRAKRLQTLPATASALTANDLSTQQVEKIDDLVRSTPSLAINDTGVGKEVNIRGIGKGADLPGIAPGVAYYVDGVPLPNQIFLDTPFFDLSRVEVLRGPQGTLVGMNSTGGAMLVVSQNPRYGVTEGSFEQSFGNYNNTRSRGSINFGLGKDWALRASAEVENRDSFFTNVGPASGEPGNQDRSSVRVALAGKPTDHLEVFIRGEYNHSTSDGIPGKPIPGDPDPLYTVLNLFSPSDPYTLSRDVAGLRETTYQRLSAELRFNIADEMELRSITGFQHGELTTIGDFDSTSLPTAVQSVDITEPVFTQELNLISTKPGKVDWVVGAFMMTQDTNGDISVNNVSDQSSIVAVTGRGRTRDLGIFGQTTYHVTDALNITAGLRWNQEKHFFGNGAGTLVGGVFFIPSTTDTRVDQAVTGRLTVDYQASPNQFLYATISRGFKGGGLNDAGGEFDPEFIWNYEAGLKSYFFDRHIKTQLGAFYNDYTGIQYEVYNPVTTLTLINNIDGAKVFGVELQGQGQFGNLGVNISIAHTESQVNGGTLVDPRYGSTTPIDLTGRTLNYSPEWTFHAGLDYEFAIGNDYTLTPNVQYSFTSSQWASLYHVTPTDMIEAHEIVDAGLVLHQAGKGWNLEIYGSNLTNQTYVMSKAVATANQPGRVQFYGAPRRYGIRLGYSF